MNVKQAATRLEISASLVYALIASGKLRCTRHGLRRGVIRISDAQVEQYLREAEQDAPPPHRLKHITF